MIYYDTKRKSRQSESQLRRRGLLRPGIDPAAFGIIELVAEHGLDTDLYIPVDTGEVEIREDGKAHVVYDQRRRQSDPDNEVDIRRRLKDKVNERRDLIMTAGINVTVDGSPHVLQTRDTEDRLTLKTILDEARLMAADEIVVIRTEDNENLSITAESAVSLLSAGTTYLGGVKMAAAGLKDEIGDAATDDDAFTAYENGIDAAWPDNAVT